LYESRRRISYISGVGALVLVVEDYADTQELYRELLAHAGFRAVGALTGEEAVRKALELVPDVILMDLSLPGIDGYEATRRIRRDPRLLQARILALTGHSSSSVHRSARQAGCDGLLTKPCRPAELVAEIKRLLDQKRA
jgi:two-component system cell cycle response regulator DivK